MNKKIDTTRSSYTESFIDYGDNENKISIGSRSVYIPPELRCKKYEYDNVQRVKKKEVKKKIKKRVTLVYRKKEYKISKLKSGKIKVLVDGGEVKNVLKTLSPLYKHVLKKEPKDIIGTRAIGSHILKALS